MTCSYCKSRFTEVKKIVKLGDGVNQYGRREIVYQVEHNELIKYNKETGLYHCSVCGLDFIFNEHTFQKVDEPKKLEVLF